MPNKDNESGSRNVGISNRPDLERPAPDKGKGESETNESLLGNEIPQIEDPKELDEGIQKLNDVGDEEDEDDDDDDDDDDDLDDEDDDDEDMDDIESIDDEDLEDEDDEDMDDIDEEINEEDTKGLNPGAELQWDPGKGKGE